MDVYDEDLTENKFFSAFQHKSPVLFQKAIENRWMVSFLQQNASGLIS